MRILLDYKKLKIHEEEEKQQLYEISRYFLNIQQPENRSVHLHKAVIKKHLLKCQSSVECKYHPGLTLTSKQTSVQDKGVN